MELSEMENRMRRRMNTTKKKMSKTTIFNHGTVNYADNQSSIVNITNEKE
ncbi:hypothetical protein [Marininema halotolerans]|nr:hypothetical protein [Marininema halotolerans]